MQLAELVQQLKGARVVIVADLDRLNGELARIDIAIGALDGADGTQVQAVPTEAKVAPVTTLVPKQAPRVDVVGVIAPDAVIECTDCGQKCSTVHGLSVHRARKHKPAQVLKVDPAPTPRATGAQVLACEAPDCGATFEVTAAGKLNTHCIGQHGRRASESERRPIANPERAA